MVAEQVNRVVSIEVVALSASQAKWVILKG